MIDFKSLASGLREVDSSLTVEGTITSVREFKPFDAVSKTFLPTEEGKERSILHFTLEGIDGTKSAIVFNSSFPKGLVPYVGKDGLSASLTIQKSGEYLNIIDVKYDIDDISPKGLAMMGIRL